MTSARQNIITVRDSCYSSELLSFLNTVRIMIWTYTVQNKSLLRLYIAQSFTIAQWQMQIAWGLVTDMGSVHQTAFLVGFSMPMYILFLMPLCTSFIPFDKIWHMQLPICRRGKLSGVEYRNIQLEGVPRRPFFTARRCGQAPQAYQLSAGVGLSVGPSVCMFYCIQTVKNIKQFSVSQLQFHAPSGCYPIPREPLLRIR